MHKLCQGTEAEASKLATVKIDDAKDYQESDMTSNPVSTYDDEIDLRAIFQTIWKARVAILIVTLAAVLVAFAVSSWLLPRKYEASAYVFIGNPVVDLTQATDITISPTLPDLKAVAQLATAPGLLASVAKDPAVMDAIGNEEISISGMTSATEVGKDQLRLQVTDTDPQRAALLANTWAEKATDTVNATYGVGALTPALDSQVLQSQNEYAQAQTALEEVLSQSPTDALSANLLQKQTDLNCILNSASLATRVLENLQTFEQVVGDTTGDTPLSLGDWLALTTLRQQLLTSPSCQLEVQYTQYAPDFTVQIDSISFTDLTISKALADIAQMRVSIQTRLTRLQSEQSRLEQEILQVRRDLENAKAQVTQITLKRDQSQGLYATLLQQQQRVATVLAQSSKAATISVAAVPPQKATSPKVMVNTALAGMLGGMLSILGALAVEWWKKG